MIPKTNKNRDVYTIEVLNIKDIKPAKIIVIIISTIAKSNTLYECAPSFGLPNIFLYLHKLIYKYKIFYLDAVNTHSMQ